jgi:hypothetical protein
VTTPPTRQQQPPPGGDTARDAFSDLMEINEER